MADTVVRGWLLLRDVAADFRELFGDEAELLGRKLSGRTLRPHDWRLMVEYGPHPAGDRRNGRVTFHAGADAAHVVEYLTREAITLEAPTAVERVDSACCDGTGYADYAAVRCPAPDCPVPEAQWRAEVPATPPVVDELAELRHALQHHIGLHSDQGVTDG